MKCVHCNTDNPEEAKFCHKCGQKLSETEQPKVTAEDVKKGFSEAVSSAASFAKECQNDFLTFLEAEATDRNDTVCPFCHSTGCQPIQKSNTNIKQSGYNLSNGCCGLCLLGPFGLLCGLCGTGSKVNIKEETWWTCLECGKEHISQKSAINKGEAMIASSFVYSFISGILLSLAIWNYGISFISLVLICVEFSLSVGIWGGVLEALKEDLGCSFIEILPPEKKKTYVYQFIACVAIVILVGIFFMPLLSAWAES